MTCISCNIELNKVTFSIDVLCTSVSFKYFSNLCYSQVYFTVEPPLTVTKAAIVTLVLFVSVQGCRLT